jgi:hypothetical protein
MSRQEDSLPITRKDFYRALTVIWAFLWFLAMSLHSPELWNTGLLLAASMSMAVVYAVQVLRAAPQGAA